MESLIDFARGPLFRFSFIIMLFGLARVIFLDIFGAYTAYQKAGDKTMPWKLIISRGLEWLFPIKRIAHNRPIYSIFFGAFSCRTNTRPDFSFAHIQLWKSGIGLSWPALPYQWAYWLTISIILFASFLLIGRIFNRTSSFLSRKQDFLWPLLLLIPFVTGFICSHIVISPDNYRFFMLIHIFSADLIFILLPFTKIAHCVLMPLSQIICVLAWKFPPETDDAVCTTLNKKGAPV